MIFLDFSTLNTMLPPYGEGWGGAPVFGHNSILYDPKLNALPRRTHCFANSNLMPHPYTIGKEPSSKSSGFDFVTFKSFLLWPLCFSLFAFHSAPQAQLVQRVQQVQLF